MTVIMTLQNENLSLDIAVENQKTNNTYVAGRPKIGSTWWDVLDEKNR